MTIENQKKNRRERRREQNHKARQRTNDFSQTLVTYTVFGLVILTAIAVFFFKPDEPKLLLEEVSFDDQSFFGNPDAPVNLVEFVDFKCPHCKSFSELVIDRIFERYIETGLVKITIINYPFLGLDSRTAALAAETMFKMDPNAFYNFIRLLFSYQQPTSQIWATPELLAELASIASQNISKTEFLKHIVERTYDEEVKLDLAIAEAMGINATPTVFINGSYVPNPSYETVVAMIEAELRRLNEGGEEI